MLIRFAVQNFLSFNSPAEFSMGATKSSRHKDHIIKLNGEKLLKMALIYGANASGKTNFVRAMHLAKKIVLQGIDSVVFEKKYFRIDEQSKLRPCVFQFDIFTNNESYSYGFAINHIDRTIIEEWLYRTNEDERIFLRSFDGSTTTVKLSDHLSKDEEKKLLIYAEGLSSINMQRTLFLTEIFDRSENIGNFAPYHDVRNWFSKLIVIFPDSINAFQDPSSDENLQAFFEKALRHFDTGIVGLKNEPTDLDKALRELPEKLRHKIKNDISKEFIEASKVNRDSEFRAFLGSGRSRLSINVVEGELVAAELLINHGNENELFSLVEESDGTRRLFDLIPILSEAFNDKVIIVDELDRSLHTKLSREFLCLYLKNSLNKHSQLIATTHDSNLLDLDFVRQDEIWFVERDKDHNSVLIPLDKFKVRFDKDIEKDYLLGRYGAIPLFKNCYSEESLCGCAEI